LSSAIAATLFLVLALRADALEFELVGDAEVVGDV
jgi:hypothetical protein